MKPIAKVYTAILFLFLFAPIVIMLVFSFNSGNSLSVLSGFSTYWYKELFHDANTLGALRNTLILALCAAILSTIMGTAAAVGMNKLRSKYMKAAMNTVTNLPMVNPEIITGISLMLMFVFAGRLMGMATSLNFGTILIAHITFCLPYVILQVLPKLRQMDKALPEAAMDLGCTPFRAFLKVELPEILPGVLTGMIMAFTLSLDDFVISYFTSGNGFETLPIRIYNMTKKTVTPKMYALATIIFFVILLLLLITNLMDDDAVRERKAQRRGAKSKAAHASGKKHKPLSDRGRKVLAGSVLGVAAALILVVSVAGGSDTLELNVYNWGEYISDGSDGSLDTVKAFEAWYEETYGEKVHVNYTTYASNEDMYAKLKSGAVSYDVIIPSDYMVARMGEEGLLMELDYSKIPNAENIDERYLHPAYDTEQKYSLPYMWGTTGIIYNTTMVDKAPTSWMDLFTTDLKGQVLIFDNPRDCIGLALKALGYSFNTTNKDEIAEATDLLIKQKEDGIVQAYVMDQIFDKMESGEAAIAPYYVGDYFLMLDELEGDDSINLGYYIPEEGTNLYVDAMCIPKDCQNKSGAEAFINFLLDPENMAQNTEFISYSTAETAARDLLDDDMKNNAEMYPSHDVIASCETYVNLPANIRELYDSLWVDIMSS